MLSRDLCEATHIGPEAAQAEFAGSVMMPEATPTQLARPANEIRTVRTN
jgi:hypothetical protein